MIRKDSVANELYGACNASLVSCTQHCKRYRLSAQGPGVSMCRKSERNNCAHSAVCCAFKETLEPAPIAHAESLVVDAKTEKSLWNRYCENLQNYPVRTKASTSLMGFAFGDILAQYLEGGSFDPTRTARIASYGLLLDGPVGHLWYRWLDGSCDTFFKDSKGTPAVAAKTAADQIIWAPAMTMVFFAFLKLAEGDPSMVWPTIQDKLVGTVAANYAIWPLAHIISFKYVPSSQRILYNNIVAIFWNCYLSAVAADTATSFITPEVLDPTIIDSSSIHAMRQSAVDTLTPGWWQSWLDQWSGYVAAFLGSGPSAPTDASQIGSLKEVAEKVRDSYNFNGPIIHHVLQASAESALVSSQNDTSASLPFLEALVHLQKLLPGK